MILTQYVELPDGRQAEAKARWQYSNGTPGTPAVEADARLMSNIPQSGTGEARSL